MKLLISGSSGLVGSALRAFLEEQGHKVIPLVRHQEEEEEEQESLHWDPLSGTIDQDSLEGFDAIIHLAGENIASGLWTEERKERILESRVKGTHILAEAIAKLQHPPKVFITASGVGFYGDRGDTLCTEETVAGKGFLADVCSEWELATEPALLAGIRTAHLRLGIVLSPKGGVLGKMLTPFKWGLGGVFGPGSQYMSWIGIDDVVKVTLHILETDSLSGSINVVAPHPVTNRVFTKTLGKVLHRSTFFPVPAFILKLVLGNEMTEELLLASTRAEPLCLLGSGYQFLYPDLEPAFEHLLENELK